MADDKVEKVIGATPHLGPDTSDDTDIIAAAVDWIVARTDGKKCPFDGQEFGLTEGDTQPLKTHLKRQHRDRSVVWYLHPHLGPDAMGILAREQTAAQEYEAPGVVVDSDDTNPRLTHVPKTVLDKLERSGSYGRWVAPWNVRRSLDRGYRFAERPDGEDTARQQDHSDTKLRANELVYMVQPNELRRRTLERKQAESEAQTGGLPATVRNSRSQLGDPGKETYEHYSSRGMPHDNAMVLARRADREGRTIRSPISGVPHVRHSRGGE